MSNDLSFDIQLYFAKYLYVSLHKLLIIFIIPCFDL